LGQLLVRAGVLDTGSLAKGLVEHERTGRPLGMTLVELGFETEQMLVSTLAHQLGLPVARIASWPVSRELCELVPIELAEKHRCLPLSLKDEGSRRSLYLAMVDPSDLEGVEAVRTASGRDVRIVLVAPSELDAALDLHYRGVQPEPAPAVDPLRPPGDPESLHHWSVSREDLLALLAEDPAAAPEGESAPAAAPAAAPAPAASTPSEIRAYLDRRRLDELDGMVKLLMQLFVESGLVSRDELVRRLSALVHEPR
jgi:hypothetical protein